MKERLRNWAIYALALIIVLGLLFGFNLLVQWLGTHTQPPVSCLFIKCIQVVGGTP